MPALAKTAYSATITWLGLVADRAAALPSQPVEALELGLDGPLGESHGGMTRPSCSRVLGLYPRNTPIRNTRQLSIVSAEELAAIAAEMGLEALDPALLGASMVVSGLPDFSHLPPSSRLLADSGACLTVDMENRPCTLPARPIETAHPGHGKGFKPAAQGRRGVTAWVEAEGRVVLGDRLTLFVPDQPVWAGQVPR
ncbi:MAG: MOSC domain-containing protein [Proteobacteria bacterium]|nr:MOSC domain-containing protein [Pseudomonadota bacterium]